jgi:CheY-like chemotaxis protein
MITTRSTDSADRFALVTAGHHFLLNVLPFRAPGSSDALATFVAALEQVRRPSAEVDAILLRCLLVLDMQHGRRIPSLTDRYLTKALTAEESLAHFTKCVRDLLRDHCISNGTVQQVVDIISARHGEPSLDARMIATQMALPISTVNGAFHREMACTVTEHIRRVRLDRSAILLVTTSRTIKEIWAEVGYNHPSNFNHHFKWRFGRSPREFRACSIRPVARAHYQTTKPIATLDSRAPACPARVLIVDDDEVTRWTLSTYLREKGFAVSVAATGSEGLRCAEEASLDVIVVDYCLDDMDGLEFLRRLHSRTGDAALEVVLFTADWNIFDRLDDVSAFGATIVSKLCDLNQLERVLVTLSQRKATANTLRAARAPRMRNVSAVT